jgi:uncharacterized protein
LNIIRELNALEKFSNKTLEKIGYYVYGLVDPLSKEYFYIGKGSGNRVFSHVRQKIRQKDIDPKFDIIERLKEFGGPEIIILRHGLSEYQALLIESTIIDVLGVNQMANKVRGLDSDRFGIMSATNLDSQYKGIEYKGKEQCICFKINKAWRKQMTDNELYDVIRGNWRVNIERARSARFGVGVYHGIIRAIYKIENWSESTHHRNGEPVDPLKPKRWHFSGLKDLEMQKYIGFSLQKHPNHKVSGPLFYINC